MTAYMRLFLAKNRIVAAVVAAIDIILVPFQRKQGHLPSGRL
jgi:hypothetical protein